MNRIWLWITGSLRIRLTGAEPERTMRTMAQSIVLSQILWESGLVVTFAAARKDWEYIRSVAERNGDRAEVLSRSGFPYLVRTCLSYPVIAATVGILLAATLWLPGRILFLQVEGNDLLPDALILERAAQCGLYFGTDRESLRSEQVKNQLLSALPELSWVGVNTVGCRAVISVEERQREDTREPALPGNIVAVTDAVVLSVTATSGNAVCVPGDAVKKGQVLISGYTDLGLCTHVEAAEGEVYGLTRRKTEAVIPTNTRIREENSVVEKKYGLIFGKKRINFYSDSGILHAGCGKMTQIRYLRLPGGWTLPVALVIETYTVGTLSETPRWELSARDMMRQVSIQQLMQQMTAGQIRNRTENCFREGDVFCLQTQYECQEMIGRRSSGILTEGDIQNDGENGERGAG